VSSASPRKDCRDGHPDCANLDRMSGCSSSWQGLRDLLHLLDHHSPAIKEAHVFVLLAICIVFVETARRVACAGTVAAERHG
jgi:hypothetical protein